MCIQYNYGCAVLRVFCLWPRGVSARACVPIAPIYQRGLFYLHDSPACLLRCHSCAACPSSAFPSRVNAYRLLGLLASLWRFGFTLAHLGPNTAHTSGFRHTHPACAASFQPFNSVSRRPSSLFPLSSRSQRSWPSGPLCVTYTHYISIAWQPPVATAWETPRRDGRARPAVAA